MMAEMGLNAAGRVMIGSASEARKGLGAGSAEPSTYD